MTEAEKSIAGLVPVKLESGEYNLKFTNRSNQLIYEKTGKRMVEYLSNMHTEAIKKVNEVKKQKTEMGMIEAMTNVLTPEQLAFIMYCGLLHNKKHKSVEDVEDDMIVSQEFVYIGAVVLAVGKLLADYITVEQSTN